ncbi:hypothetical protein [Paraburkholderia sp. 32]|uniref:hypothetical protein n=1 Tax=Paraburkholderia sp. 32 TaxID=2991057 RepID=UPI003D1DAC11
MDIFPNPLIKRQTTFTLQNDLHYAIYFIPATSIDIARNINSTRCGPSLIGRKNMSDEIEYLTAYNDYAPHEFQATSLSQLRKRAKRSIRRTCYIVRPDCIFTDRSELRGHSIAVIPLLDRQRDSLDTRCPDVRVEAHNGPGGRPVKCLMLADDAIALNVLVLYYADVPREVDLQVLWLSEDGAVLSTYSVSEDERTMLLVELMNTFGPCKAAPQPCIGHQFNEVDFLTRVFEFLDLTGETDLGPETLLVTKGPFSPTAPCKVAQTGSRPILRDAGIHIS